MSEKVGKDNIPKLVDSLIDTNRAQEKALEDLLKILKRERDALKEGKTDLIPGLLSELQEGSSRAMRTEAEREAKAGKLAEALDCQPILREIFRRLEPEEESRLRLASAGLMSAVSSLRETNYILSRQAEEHRHLADMILERLRLASSSPRGESSLDTIA